jgi:hypothetical protein
MDNGDDVIIIVTVDTVYFGLVFMVPPSQFWYNYKHYLWGDVCGSLYVYFNVKCLYSVYCFFGNNPIYGFQTNKIFLISDHLLIDIIRY